MQSGHGRKADIWSVGCTCLQMITGAPPWKTMKFNSITALMYHICSTNEPPPIPTDVSTCLKSFLMICFQRSPSERPTANSLLQHSFVNEKEIKDYETTRIEESPPVIYNKSKNQDENRNSTKLKIIKVASPGNQNNSESFNVAETSLLQSLNAIHIVESNNASLIELVPEVQGSLVGDDVEVTWFLRHKALQAAQRTQESWKSTSNSLNSWSVRENKAIDTFHAQKYRQQEEQFEKERIEKQTVKQQKWREELAAELEYQKNLNN